MDYRKALEYFQDGQINLCIDYFKQNHYDLEYAYSLMLLGKLNEAEEVFKTISSIRADWALKLIKIFKGDLSDLPTYFQIRNFLEIDIAFLSKVSQMEYIQALIDLSDTFININEESYKFFARGLLKNGYIDVAKYFLDKSLDNYYRDPELHFLYVEYYMMFNDTSNARKAVQNCLNIDSNYYPARLMYEKLNNIVK